MPRQVGQNDTDQHRILGSRPNDHFRPITRPPNPGQLDDTIQRLAENLIWNRQGLSFYRQIMRVGHAITCFTAAMILSTPGSDKASRLAA